MKRQRSLSSANSLVLCTVLPDLAKQFYAAWQQGNIETCLAAELRDASNPKAQMLRDLMARYRSRDLRPSREPKGEQGGGGDRNRARVTCLRGGRGRQGDAQHHIHGRWPCVELRALLPSVLLLA